MTRISISCSLIKKKAFDRVNRDKLWKVLEQYGVMGQLLDNIRAIYANSRSAVRTTTGTSDWFPVTSGIRQGCNLSPLFFVPYMDQITKGQTQALRHSMNSCLRTTRQ